MPETTPGVEEVLNAWQGVLSLPAAIPSNDPIVACRHMIGEESRMAHRKMLPAQDCHNHISDQHPQAGISITAKII